MSTLDTTRRDTWRANGTRPRVVLRVNTLITSDNGLYGASARVPSRAPPGVKDTLLDTAQNVLMDCNAPFSDLFDRVIRHPRTAQLEFLTLT